MTAGALRAKGGSSLLPVTAIDSPDEYRNLPRHKRGQLQAWIEENIAPRKTLNPRTSYGLKHAFENSADGFYTTNGQFKGAMLAAGYRPVDAYALNWTFRISTKGVPYV
jgi:hypothetical protein